MFFIQIHWPLTSCSASTTDPRTNGRTGSCLRSCVGFARVMHIVIPCTRKNVKNSLFFTILIDDGPNEKWLIFDGSIDNGWCENMSHAMDDNQVLILANGERIPIPKQVCQHMQAAYICSIHSLLITNNVPHSIHRQVSFIFEVENLTAASPAIVSRCGVVCSDHDGCGWRTCVDGWLNSCKFDVYRNTVSQ